MKELLWNNENFAGKCHGTNAIIILVHACKSMENLLGRLFFKYYFRKIGAGMGMFSQLTWDLSKALSNQWPRALASGQKTRQVDSELGRSILVPLTCTSAEAAIPC